ncbi:hypothetical protein DMENIID0001_056580 [Sergentomyia squamirostris]
MGGGVGTTNNNPHTIVPQEIELTDELTDEAFKATIGNIKTGLDQALEVVDNSVQVMTATEPGTVQPQYLGSITG